MILGALHMWFAGMMRWESVLQAGARVGECEELFAALNGGVSVFVLSGIAIP